MKRSSERKICFHYGRFGAPVVGATQLLALVALAPLLQNHGVPGPPDLDSVREDRAWAQLSNRHVEDMFRRRSRDPGTALTAVRHHS